ncbi:MAG: NAD-binding protein [Spirochaetaceae bacterium]|nr:NAD-binding protein [Spirochaetaceae bacterium]
MRVIIIGAGTVGTALARQLAESSNEVCLIESNEERARHVSNRLDCMVIHDEGNSFTALEEAGIARTDALVCVTNSDEINIIVCGIVAAHYPDILKIARVRNEEYVRLINERGALHNVSAMAANNPEDALTKGFLGVDYFVHPNVEASRTALAAIEHDAAGDVLSFAGSKYELGSIEIAPGSAFDGLSLVNFRRVITGETLVALLERNGECMLPSGSTALAAGDRVHILATTDEIEQIFELGGRKEGIIRKIGVVGGGQMGALVVDGLLFHGEKPHQNITQAAPKIQSFFSFVKGMILKSTRKILIIERDYELCKNLSARFPDAVVLNEDISDESFIREERLNGLDLIVTVTGNQELNIIAALYLKSAGVRRAIAMVASDGYAAIARRLGIDVVIPIKSVIVDSIMIKLLGGNVRAIHRLGDGSIAVFEIEVGPAAPIVDQPITEFKISQGALVMLVQRNGESFIPHGDYIFRSGDRIVIEAKNDSEKEIKKKFGIDS